MTAMGGSTSLEELPRDHPLRNTPLGAMLTYYRHQEAKTWRRVFPSFKIAAATFNELGSFWTDGWVWEVREEN